MGMDIEASLFVGRHEEDLDIKNAPYYKEYTSEYGEAYVYWRDLFEYYWNFDDDSLADLKYRKTYLDNDNGYIGFVIKDSGSWSADTLDWEKTTFTIARRYGQFAVLFDKKPKIFLLPYVW